MKISCHTVPCAEFCNTDEGWSESSDRHFVEKSAPSYVYCVRYNEELDPLCPLIVKIDLSFARSWLFPSINFLFRTETFLSIFLGWLYRMSSPLLRGLSGWKLCQNLDTTALSVRKQIPQNTPPKPLSCQFVGKKIKEMVSGNCQW